MGAARIQGTALEKERPEPAARRSPAHAVAAASGLGLALAVLAGCSAHRRPDFAPARGEDVARAVESWRAAVARAETLPPSRLLYQAHLTQHLAQWSGTLAVTESANRVEASLTGPFGSPVATYADGQLKGERIRTLSIGPEDFRSLLAGVWTRAEPQVRGVHAGDALLVWDGEPAVEGVLDVSASRFRSLSISRREGNILATYSAAFDPWPAQISIEESASGARMKLKLLTHETLR